MSTLIAQADPSQFDGATAVRLGLLFLAWTAVAIYLLVHLGVFSGRTILGPRRLKHDEPTGGLFAIFALAVVIWMFAPAIYAKLVLGVPVRSAPQAQQAPQPVQPVQPPSTRPATQPTTRPAAIPPRLLATVMVVASGSALLVLLLGNLFARPGGLKRLGLDPRLLPIGLAKGALGLVIVMPLLMWVSAGTELLWKALGLPHQKAHEVLRSLGHADPLVAVILLGSAILLAPLFEELMFRGHLQTLLARLTEPLRRITLGPSRPAPPPIGEEPIPYATPVLEPLVAPWRRWMAVTITAAIFAAVHEWWMAPPIFFLAMGLGYAYERTGNLWVPMTMHALFNAWNSVLYLLLANNLK